MPFTPEQLIIGAAAALLIGFSKTGVPGVGILVVPLMALVFPGRASVGTTLLLLIVGDLFAVRWYSKFTRWDKLWQLMPYVVVGMIAGTAALFLIGENAEGKDNMNVVIGVLVLVMLVIYLARLKWGDKLRPTSKAGLVTTGASAGFATTVSNAAGPIMTIYMTSLGLPKHEFMGTTAWYYLIFNVAKIPLYLLLIAIAPDKPMFTSQGLLFDLLMLPVIVVGVYLGKWMLPRVPQTVFNVVALSLAAVSALRLIFS
jgi:uncharacterized membrane protein YfcA